MLAVYCRILSKLVFEFKRHKFSWGGSFLASFLRKVLSSKILLMHISNKITPNA